MYVKVRALTGAKKENLKEESSTHFSISVREKAERNAANLRIRELLAMHFGVYLQQVRIVNGHQSPSKLLSIDIETTEDE
ncbi:MAG: DUF167 domain-containing protein [Rectinemataceae bacterium]|nr:DUF167 domain-containing protein [Rectinemataceae bacterium]